MQKRRPDLLQRYLQHWNLIADGSPWNSKATLLQPVWCGTQAAVLKIPLTEEECRGMEVMVWFEGKGAAKVFKHDQHAYVMERISSFQSSLTELVQAGDDDQATRIICGVADELHASSGKKLPASLVPLDIWFNDLWAFAATHGGIAVPCAALAHDLLQDTQDPCVLHGDLHHKNVLCSADRGWLCIDPKGLFGNRAFDYANILCNPYKSAALASGRLRRQVSVVSEAAGLERNHFLRWVAAWSALSACWVIADGEHADLELAIAAQSLHELNILY